MWVFQSYWYSYLMQLESSWGLAWEPFYKNEWGGGGQCKRDISHINTEQKGSTLNKWWTEYYSPKCRNNWFVSENFHKVCIRDTRYTCVSTNLEIACFPLPHVCIYILKWPMAEAIVSVFSISSCRAKKLLYKHHEQPSLHDINSLHHQLLIQNAIQELWWPGQDNRKE